MKQIDNTRFYALDVFRGTTIILMIIVNTPGSGAMPYRQLLHADWNGCTLTDLVFPSFLFAVGNAMSFSFSKFHNDRKLALFKICKRTVLIFTIGFFLGWYTTMYWENWKIGFVAIDHVRIMGVLQRIALCYAVSGFLALYLSPRRLAIVSISLLLLYWFLLQVFGAPGAQYTITGNAGRWLDISLFSSNHMYREQNIVFDPEGLLSTIPATVNVLAGYIVGRFIVKSGKSYETLAKLMIAGNLLLLAGLYWSYFLPLNKKLWTSSYVVFTIGIDLIALGVIFYITEILGRRRGVYPFVAMGKNPLFIYVLSNLFLILLIFPVHGGAFIDWINKAFFQKLISGPLGSLLFAACFTMFMAVLAWLMDKKRIYIRI